MKLLSDVFRSIRWGLGLPVSNLSLDSDSEESIVDFYNRRITNCEFLDDPEHYEHPRAERVLSVISGKNLLEIGCGNDGMTRLLSPKVESITAFDISRPSLDEVERLGLPNVRTEQGLVENFQPDEKFEWVVVSEVIEHLRKPKEVIRKAFEFVASGGAMVLTTPNGHWESDEHLHEFSLMMLTRLITSLDCESFECGYLRDRDNRRQSLRIEAKGAA